MPSFNIVLLFNLMLLVDGGACPSPRGDEGQSPLHIAVMLNHIKSLRVRFYSYVIFLCLYLFLYDTIFKIIWENSY